MQIQATNCCALSLIHRVGNETTENEFHYHLDKYKDMRKLDARGLPNGIGATSFMCVVCPGEEILEQTLLKVGFKYLNTFERRTGYPDGINKLYILNI